MKRLFDFIIKANQVLFFLAALVALGGTAYLIYSDFSRSYQPPHVAVALTPHEIKTTAIEDVRFLGKSADLFVFGVVKREIRASSQTKNDGALELFASSRPREDPGEIVNVIFSKGAQKIRNLLTRDGLVLRHRLSRSEESEKCEAHLFVCVTEDTDRNHLLDTNDREDLHILAKELDTPDMVVSGVVDFEIVSPTHLMVKTREGKDFRFFDVNVATREKSEVLWK